MAGWKIRAWRRRRRARAGINDPEVPTPELSPLPEKILSEKRRLSMNKRTIIDFHYDVSGLQFPTPPKAARLLPPTPPPGVGWAPQIRSQPQPTQRQPYKTEASKRDSDTPSEPERPKSARTRTNSSSSRLSKILSAARKSKSSETSFEIIPPVPPLPFEVQSNRSSSSSLYSLSDSSDYDSSSSTSTGKKRRKFPPPPVKTDVRGLPRLPTVIIQDDLSPPPPHFDQPSPAPPSYRAEPLRSPSRYDSIIIRSKPLTPLSTPKTTASSKKSYHHTRSSSSTDVGRVKRLPRLVTVVASYSPNPDRDDEMNIKIGDTLRLSEEFKDGWCRVQRLGSAGRRRSKSVSSKAESMDEGVVPQFCLQDRPDFASRHSFSPLTSGTFPKPFRLGAPR